MRLPATVMLGTAIGLVRYSSMYWALRVANLVIPTARDADGKTAKHDRKKLRENQKRQKARKNSAIARGQGRRYRLQPRWQLLSGALAVRRLPDHLPALAARIEQGQKAPRFSLLLPRTASPAAAIQRGRTKFDGYFAAPASTADANDLQLLRMRGPKR